MEIEIAYPTYRFGDVLCTHGHYLDPHARLSGSRGDRLLTRTLWAIAAGGPEEPNCIEDYESVTTLLTEWLYIAAQMPHGTHAQQNVFRAAQRAGRFAQALGAPVRGAERLAAKLRDRGEGETGGPEPLPSEAHFDAVVRGEAARQAREQPLVGPAAARPIYPEPTVVSRSDPSEHALEAFAQVVRNLELGWGRAADRLRPHPPAAGRRALRRRRPQPLLEHRLLDLRAGPRLAPGLRALPALRLARHGDPDRHRRAAAPAAGAARRPQPAQRRPRAARGLILGAAEAWPAVFGGLIPILGLAAIGYVIYRAVRDNDEDDE